MICVLIYVAIKPDLVSFNETQDPLAIPRHTSVQERYQKQLKRDPLFCKTYFDRLSGTYLYCRCQWSKNNKYTTKTKRCSTSQEAMRVMHVLNARKLSEGNWCTNTLSTNS